MKNKIVFALVALVAGLLGSSAYAQEVTCAGAGGVNCSGTIPDFPIPSSFTSTMSLAQPLACVGSPMTGVGVRVNLAHDHVGDLVISVTSPAGTTTLLNRPAGSGAAGGCSGEDIQAIFGSQGAAANTCQEATIPAITGALTATGPGIGFLQAPVNMIGAWQLTVTDQSNGFEGFVQDWALVPQCAPQGIPAQSTTGMMATILLVLSLGMWTMWMRRRRD